MKSLTYSNMSKKQIKDSLILFLIFPMAAMLKGFKNHRSKLFLNLIWAFVAFHGFTLVVTDEGMDASRYAEKLSFLNNAGFTWVSFLDTLLTTQNVDIIQPFITFIVAAFTGNQRVLFLVFGIVFGYFYSRNLGYVISKSKNTKTSVFLVIIFALTIPFWEINGFRMWTAAHIFFYAGVKLLESKQLKVKPILFLCLAPLMHFSFVLPLAILGLYKLLGNKLNIYFFLYVATFLISEIDLTQVRSLVLEYAPDFLDSRLKGYTREGQMEEILLSKQNQAFYIKYQGILYKIGGVLLISYMYIKKTHVKSVNATLYKFLNFSFLFLAVANIMSLIPSGGRFLTVANLFLVACIVWGWSILTFESLNKFTKGVAFFCLFGFAIVSVWRGFQTISVMLVIGNPIFALVSNLETSLSQVVKLEFL